jgi:hypothetical protein
MKPFSILIGASALALLPCLGDAPAVAAQAAAPASGLGDLTSDKTIASDTLALVEKGDMAGARTRATDLETAWDKAEDTMKPTDPARWRVVDKAIDKVLHAVRSTPPQTADCRTALKDLIGAIDKGGAA